MAKQFFSEWALWEKLVFILGLAIVVTIVLGLVKLCLIHRKLRKHTAIAERDRKEKLEQQQQQLSEKRTDSSSQSDVPFGVRALESGVEVEGVWHSRSNTPEPASQRSSFQRPSQDRPPRLDGTIDLEKQSRQAPIAATMSNHSVNSDPPVRPNLSLSTSIGSSRESKPAAVVEKPRIQHPPPSLSRFEGKPYLTRQLSAASTLEGLEAIHRASTELNGDSSSSDKSSNDVESIVAAAPHLFGPSSAPDSATSDRKQSRDFDLLDSRRSSFAAESGYLTPRLRRPDSNGNPLPASAAAGPDGRVDYFAAQLPAQPPKSAGSETSASSDPFTSTKYAALPAAVRQASSPVGIPSFTQFCQTNPPSPRSLSPASGHSPVRAPDAAAVSPKAAYVPLLAKPVMPAQEEVQPKRVSFEKSQPEPKVLRGHGTGFEILKQGTFSTQPEPKTMGGPPIALYNTVRARSTSIEGRKKLRKKKRMSQGSDISTRSFETMSGDGEIH